MKKRFYFSLLVFSFLISILVFSSINFLSAKPVNYQSQQIQSSVTTTNYVYGPNGLAAKVKDGDINYAINDRLGSTRAFVDSEGEKVAEFKSLPFGQSVIDTGDDKIRYGFTGKEKDDTGLHYFAARYYDSNIGRFTTTDPVAGNHPYVYVDNNPMNMIDPSGMELRGLDENSNLPLEDFSSEFEDAVKKNFHELYKSEQYYYKTYGVSPYFGAEFASYYYQGGNWRKTAVQELNGLIAGTQFTFKSSDIGFYMCSDLPDSVLKDTVGVLEYGAIINEASAYVRSVRNTDKEYGYAGWSVFKVLQDRGWNIIGLVGEGGDHISLNSDTGNYVYSFYSGLNIELNAVINVNTNKQDFLKLSGLMTLGEGRHDAVLEKGGRELNYNWLGVGVVHGELNDVFWVKESEEFIEESINWAYGGGIVAVPPGMWVPK